MMKITSKALKKYGANQEGIDFLEKNFPDGAEPLEIIEKFPDLPIGWLHFAKEYFLDREEEVNKYNEICKIESAGAVIDSFDVKNGNFIVDSECVADCTFVFHSNNVNDSHFVYNSHNVNLSNNINYSSNIDSSSIVIDSEEIRDSSNISDSDYINWSDNILFCTNINDSKFIYNSHNLVDCYFCGFVNNCNHCMFCTGLKDSSYYIFNKAVDINTFENFKQRLLYKIDEEFSTFIGLNGEEYINADKRFKFSLRLDSVFDGLSDEFYGWVGTLPNYTDDDFMNLFFRERKFENS